jgi:hypothetical protein
MPIRSSHAEMTWPTNVDDDHPRPWGEAANGARRKLVGRDRRAAELDDGQLCTGRPLAGSRR